MSLGLKQKDFKISQGQKVSFYRYLDLIKKFNLHTNIVGKSTLLEPWNRHILDSLQIVPHIHNKNFSILDMGSGAGLPGVVLSIAGYKNVTLVDSNNKKTNFLQLVKDEMNLNFKIILERLENVENLKYDIITSRALAKLDRLLTYSHKFMKKNTVLIFLKGKTANEEIIDAKKKWKFQLKKFLSISDTNGCLLVIKNLNKND